LPAATDSNFGKPTNRSLPSLKLYALCAPHLEIGGAGNNAYIAIANGQRILMAQKGSKWMAMGASVPFSRLSCGYVGASDGWTDLQNFKMDWEFEKADNGNIALTAELDWSKLERIYPGAGLRQQRAPRRRESAAIAWARPSKIIFEISGTMGPHNHAPESHWPKPRSTRATYTTAVTACSWRMKTSPSPALSLRRSPFPGEKRKATTTRAATTWCGRAT
jgi:hypothetical protein